MKHIDRPEIAGNRRMSPSNLVRVKVKTPALHVSTLARCVGAVRLTADHGGSLSPDSTMIKNYPGITRCPANVANNLTSNEPILAVVGIPPEQRSVGTKQSRPEIFLIGAQQ